MPDKIEPALSETEWANSGDPVVRGYIDWDIPIVDVRSGRGDAEQETRFIPALIALLNDALEDSDLRKITRERIAALDWVLDQAGGTGDYLHSVEDKLRPIRDALESYLPPE